ncbi:MAG: hypothetical protein CVU48_06875 [Candidatus Cloacimonetes bacterium HGW-Cloacimonetes-1]|jgi:cellulose synthase/poly-beta-1,6-N-acetylglucosamine synthase-like glycosyltransferase|nr:MAG: hypothetical protein CVU48_06875 [Candidatus Cloacimonetes bacterium HGW-Cloacimonetes-1]
MQTEKARFICSIGVICYNEADNIIKLLTALTGQILSTVEIAEIIVVSSACTDGTDDLVREFTVSHPQVRLICQETREGKSAAINLFLSSASSDLLIIESGDTIPESDVVEKLIGAFADHKVGASGGRPTPVNNPESLMGYAVHLLWRLHHRMALISPKLGEVIAFRRLMKEIPAESAVDEASIEALVKAKRLKLKYVQDAIIYNKGPETLGDFIKQRRRIQNGHLWLQKQQQYSVASQSHQLLLQVMIAEMDEHPMQIPKLIVVMMLELYCRVLGTIDYFVRKKNPFKWDIASSTKSLN